MQIPEELRYSADHEWIKVEGGAVRIGITDYAQDALGDVVFVDLPEVGAAVSVGQTMSEVESTKSVSDIYAPVNGTVAEVNSDLGDAPERLNEDPYGEGWICLITLDDPSQVDGLLDAAGYRALVEG
ncbi:MAG TPA: glycine cleavage system protein GcvH [Acidimicrobiales bacterium]